MLTVIDVSITRLRRQLAEEDDQELCAGSAVPAYLELTPSAFMQLGLEIEDQQCVLHVSSLMYSTCLT